VIIRERVSRVVRTSACLLLTAFLTLSTAVPAPAASKQPKGEKPYAVIFGTVWGPDDRPIYGIKVRIRRAQDKKPKWELYSDHNGEFAQRVAAGEADYILSIDAKGAKLTDGSRLFLPKEVTVHIYNDEREDTGLHLTK
jgi:hypothetical protein